LGVKLFNRRPFALTPEGEELYDFAYPFFSRLGEVEERLKGEQSQHLRLAASATVMKNHLPELLAQLRKAVPKMRLTLLEAEPSEVPSLIVNQKVDLAITVLHGRLSEGLREEELLRLPIGFLLSKDRKEKRFADLLEDDDWEKGKVGKVPLIGLPQYEVLNKLIQDEFARRLRFPVINCPKACVASSRQDFLR